MHAGEGRAGDDVVSRVWGPRRRRGGARGRRHHQQRADAAVTDGGPLLMLVRDVASFRCCLRRYQRYVVDVRVMFGGER